MGKQGKKKGKGSKKGSIGSFRQGLQSMTGTKRRGKKKQPMTFLTVLGWVFFVAMLGVLTWAMGSP